MKIGLVGRCVICGNEYTVKVEDYDFEAYQNGALAQVAFPSPKYSIADREFLISTICPHCQVSIFGGDDDE